MNRKPLLSICIPTANRAGILEVTLSSLLSYPTVDEEVQIVISDNASTDNTMEVVNNLITKFPTKNIKYLKNKTNIGIKNFLSVLENSDGIYCKLLNDYSRMDNESIKIIKEKIRKYRCHDHAKYYLNFTYDVKGNKSGKDEIILTNVADFICCINNKITWISNFGCFHDQIKELKQYEKFDDKLLSQQYWSLHLAKTRNQIIVCPINNANCIPVPNSSRAMTYNFFDPHVVWYYEIISHFVTLSTSQLRLDKSRLLSDFVGNAIFYYLILHRPCPFDLKGAWKTVLKYFYNVPYFYAFIPIKIAKLLGHKILRKKNH